MAKKNVFFNVTHLFIGLILMGTAGLAMAIKPSIKLADQYEKVDLEKIIPQEFSGWTIEKRLSPLVSPDVQAAINKVYAQTLSRHYINAQGERIMLSIAYGRDQNDSLAIHLPEGCYAGQGFGIQNKIKTILQTAYGKIPVARLVATKGERYEPITYWVTVGENAVYDGWDMKKVKLNYAIKGLIPDGLLFRVSSLSPDADTGYALQNRFTNDLLQSLSPKQRIRLMGFKNA